MRYSKEERQMWLGDWRQSSKSAWAYAKENGLNQQTFINWTKAEKEQKQCFVEVPPVINNEQLINIPVSFQEILIERGDIKIHIPLTVNNCFVRAIIEGLGAAL